jgi:transcriptional regulator with XRE-family HTH domain
MANEQDVEAAERAKRLRHRITARGMTLAEFARRAGFTRNIMYGLAKGRPLKPEEQSRVDVVLGPER